MKNKKNVFLIILVVVLGICCLVLAGYIICDNHIKDNDQTNEPISGNKDQTNEPISGNKDIAYKEIQPINENNWEEIKIGSDKGKTKYAVIFKGLKDEKLNYESLEELSKNESIFIIDDNYVGYDDMSFPHKLEEYNYEILYSFKCDDDCTGDGYGNYFYIKSKDKYFLMNVTTKKGIELNQYFDMLQYDKKLYSIVYKDYESKLIFDNLNGNVVKVKTNSQTQNQSFISNNSYMYSLGHIAVDNKIINFRTNEIIKEFEGENIYVIDLSKFNSELKGYKISSYKEPHSNGKIIFVNENYKEMVITPEYYYGIFSKNVVFLKNNDEQFFYKYDLENNNILKSKQYDKIYKNEMLSSNSNSAYFIVNDKNKLKIIDDKENVMLVIDNLKPENINSSVLYNDCLGIFTNNEYQCEEVCECVDYYKYNFKENKISEKMVSNSCEN